MSHKQHAAMVILGALESDTTSKQEIDFLKKHEVSGLTLFRRNIPQNNYRDLVPLTKGLQGLHRVFVKAPMLIAVDQEGGRVSRFGNDFPNQGPALNLADGMTSPGGIKHIDAYGQEVGKALVDVGVNVNFAPVADVLTNPDNTAIGDRCFAPSPENAALRAEAFLKGMASKGILGCLKHFPGQGDANIDTHIGSAIVAASEDTLSSRELIPFKKLIDISPMVMIAHCQYPALDTVEASLSSKIVTGLLRKKLGFQGIIVSDDMNMHAIPQGEVEWQGALIESMVAGVELLLVCKHLERWILAIEGLAKEAAKSPAFSKILETAAKRVFQLRSEIK